MAVDAQMNLVLIDQRGQKTRMVFQLGTFDAGANDGENYAAALAAGDQVRGALVDITDANIAEWSIVDYRLRDNTRPADADITDEAVVAVYLTSVDGEKLHNIRIPAPIDGLFLSDGVTVNTGNALLIQYVQQLAQHTLVSDGEVIDTTQANGIKSGYWRSKARTAK